MTNHRFRDDLRAIAAARHTEAKRLRDEADVIWRADVAVLCLQRIDISFNANNPCVMCRMYPHAHWCEVVRALGRENTTVAQEEQR